VSVKRRIRLLLRGSRSLFESDRRLGGSPIEKIYETYGKTEEAPRDFRLCRGGSTFGMAGGDR